MVNVQKFLDYFLLLNVKFASLINKNTDSKGLGASDKFEILKLNKEMINIYQSVKDEARNLNADEKDEITLHYGEKLFECFQGKINEDDFR